MPRAARPAAPPLLTSAAPPSVPCVARKCTWSPPLENTHRMCLVPATPGPSPLLHPPSPSLKSAHTRHAPPLAAAAFFGAMLARWGEFEGNCCQLRHKAPDEAPLRVILLAKGDRAVHTIVLVEESTGRQPHPVGGTFRKWSCVTGEGSAAGASRQHQHKQEAAVCQCIRCCHSVRSSTCASHPAPDRLRPPHVHPTDQPPAFEHKTTRTVSQGLRPNKHKQSPQLQGHTGSGANRFRCTQVLVHTQVLAHTALRSISPRRSAAPQTRPVPPPS